jgi:succinate dehydrogenase/fumarate reductase cytochrome b subunit
LDERDIAMRKFHKFNALIIIVFAVAHIGNHLFFVGGPKIYNQVQDALNAVYRFPGIEQILLLSITMQTGVGLVLVVRSLRQKPRRKFWQRDFWEKAQIISAVVFAVFIIEHLYALALVRWFTDLETSFYWPASVMSGPPFTYYFIPYYFLGVLALFTHIGIGLRYWAVDAGQQKLGDYIGIGAITLGAICSAVIVLALYGTFYEINLPPEWINYLKSFYPNYAPE